MAVTISSIAWPAGIALGQRTMHGTRKPPSHTVIFAPRNGSDEPDCICSGQGGR